MLTPQSKQESLGGPLVQGMSVFVLLFFFFFGYLLSLNVLSHKMGKINFL